METILIPGAEIYYDRNFLPAEEATILFGILQTKCAWQRHRSSFKYAVPRDEAYYGDPGTNYTYSRREYKPLTWIPELFSLKTRIEETTPGIAYSSLSLPRLGYNAVLCNLCRNGNDSVGLHADAEPEMGPVIASVSLGAERLFRLKGKNGAAVFAERLPHGSLFIMAGNTQKNFKHPAAVRQNDTDFIGTSDEMARGDDNAGLPMNAAGGDAMGSIDGDDSLSCLLGECGGVV